MPRANQIKKFKALGLCLKCGGENDRTYTTCSKCAERQKETAAKTREKAMAEGKCSRCRQRPAKEGKKLCLECTDIVNSPEKKAINKAYRERMWTEFLDAYGNVCVCCGERNPKFLTISHVNGDGAEHRKRLFGSARKGAAYQIILEAKKLGWPDTLTIECFNCNMGKERNNGVCPHNTIY